ncbi:isovaleryl-CoA dehydrogenase [Pararobbsia alpina]|uniref:Acyl-CoA dehydrogenase AidB n=1 Tax=Pararobbsia alpina TaxID=621374 RepID=A0A6S7AVL2_9BURK|nr:isovaleryl-CoA dehydrogenase [Pararobbsia alpina]CAB3778966.1 Putative acyl-CoA dehydrogenase AidB [Pararobbsia alpina]
MDWTTHEVTNQVPSLVDYNLFDSDAVLTSALGLEGADWHRATLQADGERLGRGDIQVLAELANRHVPELFTHDARGERLDAVEFHPSWHALLGMLRREGLHALPFSEPGEGAMVARAAGYFLHAQVESGTLCPATMTFASIPVLSREPSLFATIQDKLFSREHDPRDLPLKEKRSMLVGMGMTEKQGGSDVRSNRTRATPTEAACTGRGAAYQLVGHKWFFSVPQSDAHLVLARTDGQDALSCFYVPRFTPDGKRNAVHIQRLKDKLGNRSNASSEVEFRGAWGVLVGEEARGIPTIIEMANYTRLDCVIGSAALMRAALVQAIHHARHRSAFGRALAQQPLMQNVLADLAIESEAATMLMMRLARAYDVGAEAGEAPAHRPGPTRTTPLERGWQRIVTPAAKFWVCKRALEFTGEAMEVWGGNGYVEEAPMARFYREAPVNSIWEGSGNVMCLDVLRAVEREPDAVHALLDDWREAAKGQPVLRAALDDLHTMLTQPQAQRESLARRIAQRLVLLAQAVLMTRGGDAANADAFIATRLGEGAGQNGRVYGTLPAGETPWHRTVIERAFPAHAQR